MWPFSSSIPSEAKTGPLISLEPYDILVFRSLDRREAITVSQLPDGTFRYRGYRIENDYYSGEYWMTYPGTGIYGSAKIALNEAKSVLPWLRAALEAFTD